MKLGWKLWLGILVAVVVLLLLGVSLGWFGKRGGPEVEVEAVSRRTIVAKVSESGIIQPDVEVPVSSDVSGEVVSLHVVEGQYVRRGQLLFTVRPDNFQAALEQSNAALLSARADYENWKAQVTAARSNLGQDSINFARQKQLYEQKVISQQDFENARLAYEVRKSQLEQARQQMNAAFYRIRSSEASRKQAAENLARTSVYASMDGTVTLLTAEVGTRLVGTQQMAGTEAMRIADLTDMEVQVEINENDIVRISIGDSATIEVDAFPNRLFKGKVSEIAYSSTTAASATGQGSSAGLNTQDQVTNYAVKVAILPESYVNDAKLMAGLAKTRSPFRPGMSAMVNIFVDRADSVLAVPIQAVTIDRTKVGATAPGVKPQEIAYLVQDSSAGAFVDVRNVTTGISDDAFIEIKEGLQLKDRIVSGPYTTINKVLNDGMQVTVKPADPKGAGKGKPGSGQAPPQQPPAR